MPKAEKGTAKDIGNRIKAKGLQKLKFYCQMCEKQCRDANGFKCHMTSESHLRNMKIFSQNASGIMDGMSKDFEKTYIDTLRRRHGTKRVNANNVYQEQIADKAHIHMNSTKWANLADFIQYLGRTGKCIVDETERGWYVQYVERDTGILERQEAREKRVEAEKAAEDRYSKQMEIQKVEAAKMLDRAGGVLHTKATKLNWEGEVSISLSLGSTTRKSSAASAANKSKSSVFGDDDDEEDEDEEQAGVIKEEQTLVDPATAFKSRPVAVNADTRAPFNLEKRKNRDDETPHSPDKKARKYYGDERKEYWVRQGILVRIISKKLANGKYYNRKAVIERVLDDKFTAEVEVLDSGPDVRDGGDVIRLDQEDLETVIPKEGKKVRILNGGGRGKSATVVSLDKDRERAKLELDDGTILGRVDYHDISKMA
jgi:DNA/RNA-binding protein KIN17